MANRFWVGGTATWDNVAGTKWSTTSGGGGGAAVPTSADDVFVDAASGAGTLTISGARVSKSLSFSGYTGALAGSGSVNVNGSLTWGAGMTQSFAGAIVFNGSGAQTITSNGKTFGTGGFQVNGAGGTWTLQDALTTAGVCLVSSGTLDCNGKALTCGTFNMTGFTARSFVLGGVTLTVSGTGATVWSITGANFTFSTNGASRLVFTGITTASTFTGGSGVTYDDIEFQGGTSSFAFATNAITCRDLFLTNPSGSSSYVPTVGVTCRNFDCTTGGGFAGTWSGTGALSVSGDFLLSPTMTTSIAGQTTTLSATTGPKNVTTQGKTIGALTFNGAGGSWKVNGNLTCAAAIVFQTGSVDISGLTVQCTRVQSFSALTRVWDMTGSTFNVTGTASGTSDSWLWNNVVGVTMLNSGSVINIQNTTATGKSFAGGGLSYPEVHFIGTTGVFLMTGNNTFEVLTWPAGATITLTNGDVQTVGATFAPTGAPGNLIVVRALTPGTPSSLFRANNDVKCDYLDVTDVIVTGGARWWAGRNSINRGGGRGWRFADYSPRAMRKRRAA